MLANIKFLEGWVKIGKELSFKRDMLITPLFIRAKSEINLLKGLGHRIVINSIQRPIHSRFRKKLDSLDINSILEYFYAIVN